MAPELHSTHTDDNATSGFCARCDGYVVEYVGGGGHDSHTKVCAALTG